MPRKKPKYHPEHPIHITARCINKEWFSLPMEEVWRIFTCYLDVLPFKFDIEILAFVLMNNHFHLLILDPKMNVSRAMNYFMRETSRSITMDCCRINQTYGAPFHPTIIEETSHLFAVYKYILRNPVNANMVSKVEEYPYSTLHGLIGSSQLKIQVSELHESIFEVVQDTERVLEWLNAPIEQHTQAAIKQGLRRALFSVNPNQRRENIDLKEV